jgi:hypothetical protein
MSKRKVRSLSAEEWCEVVGVFVDAGDAEIIIEPLIMGGGRWWGVAAHVNRGTDRIELGKSRLQRTERKVWRRFETAFDFLTESLKVKRIHVETEPPK